ncbi:MAG: carboxypeptidase-like regulatory domain-containing protein [Planctomycetia bacterium]
MKSALRYAAILVAVCIGSMAVADRTAHAQGSGARNFVLDEGGVMNGEVRSSSGQPLSNARVSILQGGRQVAVTQTNAEGMFSIGGLREGEHVLQAANQSLVYRFWQPGSAPPNSENFASIVYRPEEVAYSQPAPSRPGPAPRRGFLRRSFANYPVLTTAALLGAGIGSGIAIGSSGGGSTPASP